MANDKQEVFGLRLLGLVESSLDRWETGELFLEYGITTHISS